MINDQQGRDLFNDAELHTLVKLKKDPQPDGVYIGKTHDHLGYGQTGYALWNDKWELEFFPDGEDQGVTFIIDKNDFWFLDKEWYHD